MLQDKRYRVEHFYDGDDGPFLIIDENILGTRLWAHDKFRRNLAQWNGFSYDQHTQHRIEEAYLPELQRNIQEYGVIEANGLTFEQALEHYYWLRESPPNEQDIITANFVDVGRVMESMRKRRQTFQSERDLQWSLLMAIRDCYCKRDLICLPEWRVKESELGNGKRNHVDIRLKDCAGTTCAIELKFIIKDFVGRDIFIDEFIDLERSRGGGGVSDFCYNALNDIVRLETLLQLGYIQEGWFVFMVNHAPLIFKDGRKGAGDQEIRFKQNTTFSGTRIVEPVRNGKRKDPIILQGIYDIKWWYYNTPFNELKNKDEEVYYTVLEVTAENIALAQFREKLEDPSYCASILADRNCPPIERTEGQADVATAPVSKTDERKP